MGRTIRTVVRARTREKSGQGDGMRMVANGTPLGGKRRRAVCAPQGLGALACHGGLGADVAHVV